MINVLTNGGSLDWKAAAKVYAISAITALATYGIGSASSALFSNWYSQATFQALSHATIQGISSELNGGEFWRGALVGAVSSIAASAYSGGMSLDGAGNPIAGTGFNSIGDNLGGAGMIAFGTLAGGASAKLSGGNFWQGAVTGLVVSGLNHGVHEIQKRDAFAKRFHKIDPYAKPKMNMESIDALLEDVDGLDKFHKASGNYEITISDRKNSGLRGYTIGKKHILYDNAFTSNYKLASTMFHEFYHGFQEVFMGGLAYTLAAKVGKFGFINGDPSMPWGGEAYIERHAYQFEYNLGNHSSYVLKGINDNK